MSESESVSVELGVGVNGIAGAVEVLSMGSFFWLVSHCELD